MLSPTSQVRRPMSMAPVAAAISAMSSGAAKSARRPAPQSIVWPGPAMKPSSDIALFTTTLPVPVLVSLTFSLKKILGCGGDPFRPLSCLDPSHPLAPAGRRRKPRLTGQNSPAHVGGLSPPFPAVGLFEPDRTCQERFASFGWPTATHDRTCPTLGLAGYRARGRNGQAIASRWRQATVDDRGPPSAA